MSLKNISLKSKLVFMLLGIAMGCILIVGYQGLHNGEKALNERIYDQLTSVRESKRYQVETWYKDVQAQVRAMAVEHTTIYAMREFGDAVRKLADEPPELKGQLPPLQNYYEQEYFPRLQKTIQGEPLLKHYLPKNPAAQYLQLQYIANNPNPVGEKDKLQTPETASYYNGIHKHYHPVFQQLLKSNDFYDIFLIDIETGNIVYSVFKEVDYATSLLTGPYRTSNLGQLFGDISQTQNHGEVLGVDFDFYKPSYGKPSMFMGTTIFDLDQRPIGILVVQMPVSRLDDVMTGQQGWQQQGLGETGEAYLVGDDMLMRSNARPVYADGETCYARQLQDKLLMDQLTADKICQLKTSILFQKVEGDHISNALNGKSGTIRTVSYTGHESLAAYAPLLLGDMKWAIVAQLDKSEANAPIRSFQKELGISTVLLASAVTFLAMLLAALFIRPLNVLMDGVRKLSRGETNLDIAMNRNDEYGELAKTLNNTAQLVQQQGEVINQKEAVNQRLLQNILPEKAARQFSHGKRDFAERADSATILYTRLIGLSDYLESHQPEEAVQLLNQLFQRFDKLADHHGMEKFQTISDSYLAVCGLNVSRLDHSRRAVDFAKELLEIMPQFNAEQQSRFALCISINCGPVIAGVIGEEKFAYNLLGKTIQLAERLRFETAPDTIIINQPVFERLNDREGFQEQPPKIIGSDHEQVNTWVYSPPNQAPVADTAMSEYQKTA